MRTQIHARPTPAAATAAPVVQPKLAVSVPNDRYEQEADRVADQVMRTEAAPPSIQRICKECEEEQDVQRQADDEEEEDDTTLQGKRDSADPLQAPEDFAQRLAMSRSAGAPLQAQTRSFFEPRFGRDFGDVRVHDGAEAASLAGSVQAKAFTVGRDIFFGHGQYAPQTERGRGLIAHELVHTVQQGGGAVRRQDEDTAPPEPAEGNGTADPSLVDPEPFDPRGASFGLGDDGGTEEQKPEEANVSRATDSVLDHPEETAASERPYETGMSPHQLDDALGEGRSLDPDVRSSMESHCGAPLSGLRVHDDSAASSLATRFGARAFTFGNHVAFGSGQFAPHTDAGSRLLRHEVAHAVSPTAQRRVFRACTTNCPPGTATAFSAVGAGPPNCYGYAIGQSGRLNPGQIARTAEFTRTFSIIGNPASTPAARLSVLPYFTASHVKTNTEADIGSAISGDCTGCCTGKRKIIEVCADAATGFRRTPQGTWFPMVTATQAWDFHWYRKDADRSWSHKRNGNPTQQDDSAGATPICNPCNAARNHPPFNYTTVVGSWCI